MSLNLTNRNFLCAFTLALLIFVCFYSPDDYIQSFSTGIGGPSLSMLARVSLDVTRECSLDKESPCLPPLVDKTATWVVSHGNKLAFCKIEKVMSTFMTATMCYLNRSQEFIEKKRNIHTDTWFIRFCGYSIEYEEYKNQTVPANYSMASVIRHPLTRFLSGFMDKCVKEQEKSPKICYQCNRSLSCFIDNFYIKGRRFSHHPWAPDYEQKHFLPQNWYCPFSMQEYAIIPYGDDERGREIMVEKFLGVIRNANATQEQLTYIEQELNYKSPHATKNNDLKEQYKKELLESPEMMRKFLHIFYFDFIFFGIPLPGLENMPN